MKILVLGSGGREHALAWKIAQSPSVRTVYCAPGNDGIDGDALALPDGGDITNPGTMVALAQELGVDLTVVGPEAPLVAGVADAFAARGLAIFGPSAAAAQLEGSKIFAKSFMNRYRIPTAQAAVAADPDALRNRVGEFGYPVVIKADGLAAGKGVVIAYDRTEALAALDTVADLGLAGRRVLIEQFLAGEEMTFMVVANRRDYTHLAPTQDHKAAFNGDLGPNTGGMGAYADDGIMQRLGGEALRRRILSEIVEPTLAGMMAEGMPYCGALYFGLMIVDGTPYLLEYNARLGDPETQAIMMHLESDLLPLLMLTEQPRWRAGAAVCVVLASRGYPGKFDTGFPIHGLDEAAALPDVKVFHAGTALRERQYVTKGGRVLGVAASGGSLAAAIERAYQAVDKIRFDGMHYRRDIGAKGLR